MTDKEKHGIEFLKALPSKLSAYSYADLTNGINRHIPSVPVSISKIDKFFRPGGEATHPYLIYRARENKLLIPEKSADIKYPYKRVDEISIIPENKIHLLTDFGRCNKPHDALFYGSNNMNTACYECVTKGFTKGIPESKFLTVGVWKLKEPLFLADINYSEKDILTIHESDKPRYERLLEDKKRRHEKYLTLIEEENLFDKEYASEILEFFASEFAKTEINGGYDYMLSNYYADRVFQDVKMEEGRKPDGLLYPSIVHSYQENNIVIHRQAMEKMEFMYSIFVWMVHHANSGDIEFIPMEQVKANEDGILQWNEFKHD